MFRRFRLIIPTALILGVSLASAVKADTAAQARKAIQAAYDQQDAAQARKDLNATFAHCAPEFKDISKDGRVVTLTQARASLTQAYAMAKSIKVRTTIADLHLTGNKAIVTTKQHAVVTLVNPRTSRTMTLMDDEVDQDTWVKRSNRWWATESKTLKETRSVK